MLKFVYFALFITLERLRELSLCQNAHYNFPTNRIYQRVNNYIICLRDPGNQDHDCSYKYNQLISQHF